MKSKIAAALAATCLVLASCGGDDSSSGGGDGLSGAVNDALAASIEADGAPVELTADDISCVAGKVLENADMKAALETAYDEGKEGEELLSAIDESASFEHDAGLMMLQCLPAEKIVDLLSSEMAKAKVLPMINGHVWSMSMKRLTLKNWLADSWQWPKVRMVTLERELSQVHWLPVWERTSRVLSTVVISHRR